MKLLSAAAMVPVIGLPGPIEAASALKLWPMQERLMKNMHVVRFGILEGGELTLWPLYHGVPVLRATKICNRIVIDRWSTTPDCRTVKPAWGE